MWKDLLLHNFVVTCKVTGKGIGLCFQEVQRDGQTSM